jgi:FKBP-type peptidyl-prolyl cis-trans isomerase
MTYMMRRICLALLVAGSITACAEEPTEETMTPPTNTSAPRPGAIPAPADVAAVPADATVTASGLAWKILRPGTGSLKPTASSRVLAHYTGWTTDGQMFDSSLTSGEPLDYPLSRLIPGWIEGMQLMVVGEKRRMWIPSKLAYNNAPGSPQGMLVFDIELLDFK